MTNTIKIKGLSKNGCMAIAELYDQSMREKLTKTMVKKGIIELHLTNQSLIVKQLKKKYMAIPMDINTLMPIFTGVLLNKGIERSEFTISLE